MSVINKALVATALVLALSACKKKEEAPVAVTPAPVEVAPAPVAVEPAPVATEATPAEIMISAINLGNAVGADGRVAAPTTVFGTKDVIYAAVDTKNASSAAALAAKWTYQDGQVVKEDSVNITPVGDTVTSFKLSNDKGWPVGKYKVEITLNGNASQAAEFEVK